jgi:2-keto-4-pentenoate hydratase
MLREATSCDVAARHLVAARVARRAGSELPASCRPTDRDSALAIQRRVGELLGEPIAGWKCALPNTDRIIVAPLYASVVGIASPWRVSVRGPAAQVEPEIALVLGRDLPPRDQPYANAEIRDAVAEVRLAIELLGCRYAAPDRVDFLELLADGLFNAGVFIGPEVPGGLNCNLAAFRVRIDVQGSPVQEFDGRHPDGHPVKALHWLANFLSSRNEGLRAGQAVITGSYAGVLEMPLDTPIHIAFGELGSLSVQLAPEE